MQKTLAITSTILGLTALALIAPTGAEARFGAGSIADAIAAAPAAQPAQYYGGYRGYRSYYARRYYRGGYYSDYYRYGYPGSRNSLDTCAYC